MYFQGFDSTGKMLVSVGSMIVDGAGNLIEGVYDQNGLSVSAGPHTMTGTYTVGRTTGASSTNPPAKSSVLRSMIRATAGTSLDGTAPACGDLGCSGSRRPLISRWPKSPAIMHMAYIRKRLYGRATGIVGRFTIDGAGNVTQGAFDSVMAVGGYGRVDSYTGSMVINGSTGGTGYGRGTMTYVSRTRGPSTVSSTW